MGNNQDPDYLNLKVPEGKEPEEYKWAERRADILQNRILGEGGTVPWAINKSELARHYDKDPSTIFRDIEKRIKPYLKERIGEDAEVEAHQLFRDITENIREDAEELREAGEHAEASKAEKRAAQVHEAYWGWLFDTGVKEKAADKMEVDARVEMETRERKVYVGVDFSQFPGLDRSQMVGVRAERDTEEGQEEPDMDEAESEDIEVEEP